jgi:hypothetical protein
MVRMNINEIKKSFYKEDPVAKLIMIRKGKAYYQSEINGKEAWFDVPLSDMGDADFLPNMQAKHLIRWLQS